MLALFRVINLVEIPRERRRLGVCPSHKVTYTRQSVTSNHLVREGELERSQIHHSGMEAIYKDILSGLWWGPIIYGSLFQAEINMTRAIRPSEKP